MDDLSATTQSRRRTLPPDPSEDDLARHWSLTPADLAAIAECRGPDQRRRFALQLCVMRAHGRFLDDYPKSANTAVIKGDIVRLCLIEDLLGADADLGDLDPRIIRQLGQLGRRYDAGDLRRFAKPKRDALVACYLVEARKTLLDQIVEMNDLFLTGMNRRARTSVEKRRKSLRRRARDGLHRVLGAVDALVAADGAQSVSAFRDAQNPPARIEAAIACRAYERLEARGHLDAMLARYGTLRQYLPAFLRPAVPSRGRQRDPAPGRREPARTGCRQPRPAHNQ